MRLLLALFALVSLAALPDAGAAEPACPSKSVTVGQHERHTVTVHRDCTVDVTLNEGIICLGGGVGRSDTDVGPVHITQYYCTYPGFPPDLISLEKPEPINVFVPEFMGCTWAGSYKPFVSTPLVVVWIYTCDPPT